jgi:redox-sensitive bicupin YhaK (pirin superfamily)
VISGSLKHQDTLNNEEEIKRGGVQFTSAGSGIMHSEYNHSPTKPVHFLQVWFKPDQQDLKPSYQTAHFTDEEKHGKLCLIVSSKYHGDSIKKDDNDDTEKKAPVVVNQNAQVYASLLARDEAVSYNFGPERCGYLHVCDTGGRLRLIDDRNDEELVLEAGDGAYVKAGSRLQLVGANDEDDKRVEFLLFDLVKEEKDRAWW